MSQYIEVVDKNDEGLLWLKFHKHSDYNSSHLYFCCTYISPKSSGRFQLDDVSKLDKLHNDVMKFNRKGRVMILGDIHVNCRTGTEDDFIDIQPAEQFVVVPDDDDIHISDVIVNNCVNKHRMSEDKIVNENGKQLLNMCKTDNLFIVNGRIGSDPKCDFNCHTARGQSVVHVDYFIVDGLLLRNISVFSVNKLTPLSDHCSIIINMRLDACATQKTESNSKVRTYYKWKEADKMIYNEAINSVEYQVQLSDIKNNLSTSDTDINDTVQIIKQVILEAATPSKTTTSIGKFNAKLQASPWYDSECKAQLLFFIFIHDKSINIHMTYNNNENKQSEIITLSLYL